MRAIRILTALVAALVIAAGPVAMEDADMDELKAWARSHANSVWYGESELWLDPAGNDAQVSEATVSVQPDSIAYTWVYEGSQQTGLLQWEGDILRWNDSWHQPEGVALTVVPGNGSIAAAEYSYPAGEGPDWHWRIKLSERPDGTLVLQMTNIAPWGEEARAVRTVVHPSD
jgi:hypothetical protein